MYTKGNNSFCHDLAVQVHNSRYSGTDYLVVHFKVMDMMSVNFGDKLSARELLNSSGSIQASGH